MATFLFIDLETRSAVDLKKAGAHVYFESETTDVWCACWALDDGPVETWWPSDPPPSRVVDHILAGGTVSGWNVGFERLGFERLLAPRYGWPTPQPEQYDDTAAAAAAAALPRDLGSASVALGLPVQKDMDGKRLMMQMARPRTREPLRWWDDDGRKARLAAYCVIDVETERAARARLVPLSDDERAIWLLDAKINARGIGMDVELANAMLAIVDQTTARLNAEMSVVTGGHVTAASQVTALTEWLRVNGVPAASLAKAAMSELLDLQDVPPACRRALEIRKEAAVVSTAKLKSVQACTGADGSARGLMLYHGAGTGRWSGRLFQPHNITRGSGVVKNAEAAAPVMLQRSAALVELFYGPPLRAVSDCLRSVIRARPGRDLLAADFSAIEGRVTAWLSGEDWKLDAFRANDADAGPGMYELTAAGIFDIPVERVTKKGIERQVGKVAELALGFAGGVMAFHSMAKNYPDVKMETALAPLWAAADEEVRERAVTRYERCLRRREQGTDVMSRDAWVASELTKVGWRAKHPATAAAWAALEDGARAAVEFPGRVVEVLKVAFLVKNGFLWMRLPSGRCLAYGAPRIKLQVYGRRRTESFCGYEDGAPLTLAKGEDDSEIMAKDQAEALAARGLFKIERAAKSAVTALGVNSMTRKWERFALYSGLIMENAVQAIARDIMAAAMLRSEAAGYPIVLTVHDEIVSEPPEAFGSVSAFEALICEREPWMTDIPIAASGWRGKRYRKD